MTKILGRDCLRVGGFACLLLAVPLGLLTSCSSSTEPGVEGVVLNALPLEQNVSLQVGESREFSVTAQPSSTLEVVWNRAGEQVATTGVYAYEANYVGSDTVSVQASAGDTQLSRTWLVTVRENAAQVPPEVPNVHAGHGDEGGQVAVGWERIPPTGLLYSVDHYEVAVSVDGPINVANWAEATVVATVPEEGLVLGYEIELDEDGVLITGGERSWFAVRGVDTAGQMSPVTNVVSLIVSIPWYIEGYLYDDRGNTLPNAIVSYGCPECKVNTDGTGFYSIGPFRDFDEVVLETITSDDPPGFEPYTSYYDFRTDTLRYDETDQVDFTLITRYPMDAACLDYEDDFIGYFRFVTQTHQDGVNRPGTRLYRWDHYPISVYIPEFTVTYQDSIWTASQYATEMVELWNTTMEEDYFVLTDDEASADVYFDFVTVNEHGLYGEVVIIEPSDEDYTFGEVIPERMRVDVSYAQSSSRRIREIALHELGHVLAFSWTHSPCDDSLHLMRRSSSGSLLNGWENGIHPDERRVVNCVRVLPQGVEMSHFESTSSR